MSYLHETNDSLIYSPEEKLLMLRKALRKAGCQAVLVPRGDEHMGEYVAPHSERLAWLTDFTGSAGFAVVTEKKAAVFVDGRYTLQVKDQVDPQCYAHKELGAKQIAEWLMGHLSKHSKIAFDPWLHTKQEIDLLKELCHGSQFEFLALKENLIDQVWDARPDLSSHPAQIHDLVHAGVKSSEKRETIAKILKQKGADCAFLTLPDSISWLLNIRGRDVAHFPVPLCFASIDKDAKVCLYIDPLKVTSEVRKHLGNEVHYAERKEIEKHFLKLDKKKVLLDKQNTPFWCDLTLRESGAELLYDQDPCLLLKAKKNESELSGIRSAHIRDGAAITRFLAWLSKEVKQGQVTELSAQEKLLSIRREDPMFQDSSFSTISGAGPNGAIVHYKSSPETNRAITPNLIYLVDSGAQYLDGTTDITRTLAIGTPTPEQKRNYTLVLKGHIALARAKFPEGTTGSQLDALARYPLWQNELDYNHGTGHGVGCFLSVHEGPQRIAKAPNLVALQPGMILSNEPGYYKAGEYGIRIENLIVVKALPKTTEFSMLCFETITFAPYDLSLIDVSLLSEDERHWVNDYHSDVREKLSPLLDPETKNWLDTSTCDI